MIVRNWMLPDPVTVGSDTLVSEAKRILADNNLRALLVVDDGRLRGLLTRRTCLRAAEHVTRSQDAFEFQYFANRLKVKDVMVRNPKTVDAGDSMESCLLRGQEEHVSQFPVLDGGRVVGLVSATEVFALAAHMLGVWESWCGLTLGPVEIATGTLSRVAAVVEAAGGTLKSMITIGEGKGPRRVIIRFRDADVEAVAQAVEAAGYSVMELCAEMRSCRDLRRPQLAAATR